MITEFLLSIGEEAVDFCKSCIEEDLEMWKQIELEDQE